MGYWGHKGESDSVLTMLCSNSRPPSSSLARYRNNVTSDSGKEHMNE